MNILGYPSRILKNQFGGNRKFIGLPPFFARVGGKTKLSKKIVSLIPKHKIYVEAFVGGGSVFFRQESDIEILNDLDKDIYHLWNDMKAIGNQIQDMNFKCSKKIFNKMKELKPKDRFERLFRNLYLSKFSFSGNRSSFIGDHFCEVSRYKNIGGNLKINAERYKERLKNVKIYNKDYRKIIKEYDSPETFFYFDPPYFTKKGKWGYEPISPYDLYDALKNINGKFILSYENNPIIKKLFSNYKIKKIKTVYEISGARQNVYELLIMNY